MDNDKENPKAVPSSPERVRLHRLLTGPSPSSDRIFHHGLWSRGHNNPRAARLLPLFDRLDRYLIMVSDNRVRRGIERRVLKATRAVREPAVFAAANRRYQSMFTFSLLHIAQFEGRVVIDKDEHSFDPRELQLLNQPNVAAVVVITEGAARRLRELGLRNPCHVIPQGVDLSGLSEERVAAVAARHRQEGDVVVGYIAAWFLTRGDRGHNPLYDLDHVLELWDLTRTRHERARLWLIGRASKRAREICASREDVLLFEDIPFGAALPYVANFDVGLYPRRGGLASLQIPVKAVEYMGAGVPIVSYDHDLELANMIRNTGTGILASTPGEFVDAIDALIWDERRRRELGERGRATAATLDWKDIAKRYQDEVLNRCLL